MSSGLPEVLLLPEIGEEAETALERTTPADALGALLECSALLAADGAARPAEHRITSYNVCYTKLLRYRVDVDVGRAGAGVYVRTVSGFIGEPVVPGDANLSWSQASGSVGEAQ